MLRCDDKTATHNGQVYRSPPTQNSTAKHNGEQKNTHMSEWNGTEQKRRGDRSIHIKMKGNITNKA